MVRARVGVVRAASVEREGEGVVPEQGLVPYKKVMDALTLTDSGCQRYCACSDHLDGDAAAAADIHVGVTICHSGWHRWPSSQPSRHQSPCWGG